MRHWSGALLCTLALLSVCAGALSAPAPQNIIRARTAVRYDPIARCPDIRPATVDDSPVAVVRFRVGTSGVPSQASVSSPSGVTDLDAAAVNCVLKLRFQPATRLGDAEAIESWQEMAWKAAPAHHDAKQGEAPAAAAGSAPVLTAAAVAAPVAAVSKQPAAPAGHAAPEGAQVQVCVDGAGKLVQEPTLVHSSGDAELDAAALRVARAGSGAYRSPVSPNSAAGCMQLTLQAR
jgi:TonB family protein